METDKLILIKKCSDPMFWYSEQVGKKFPLIRIDSLTKEYITRATDGYLNIVKPYDSKIINRGKHDQLSR